MHVCLTLGRPVLSIAYMVVLCGVWVGAVVSYELTHKVHAPLVEKRGGTCSDGSWVLWCVRVCLRWASEFCMCVAVGAVCVVRALFFLLTCIYLYVLYLYILKGGFIYMSGNV